MSDQEGRNARCGVACGQVGRVQNEVEGWQTRTKLLERIVRRPEEVGILGQGLGPAIRIAAHAFQRALEGGAQKDVVNAAVRVDRGEERVVGTRLEEGSVSDHDVDACIEPTVHKAEMRDSGATPELRQIKGPAMRERNVIQVCNCGRPAGRCHSMTHELCDGALARPDRSRKYKQVAH